MNSPPVTEYAKHPRGQRVIGSCAFIECTEDAVRQVRVTRGEGLQQRIVVDVCADHGKALDGGMTLLVEFHKG